MAAKKPQTKSFSVTGTINNLQISLEIRAVDLSSAIEEAKKLKLSNFIDANGDIFDYEGPEITSVWLS